MKTKIILLVFFYCMLHGTVFCQKKQGQARIDSLLSCLSGAKEDTLKAKTLMQLGYEYYSIDPDKGYQYGSEAEALAAKLYDQDGTKGWKFGIANSNRTMGICMSIKADFPKALEHFFKALKINETTNDIDEISKSLSDIGNVYMRQGDVEKTMEYCTKSLKLSEQTKNKNIQAVNMSTIGSIYQAPGKYKESLEYYLKALKLDEELGYLNDCATVMGNIAAGYNANGEYLKMLEYDQRSLKIFEKLKDVDGRATSYANLGSDFIAIATDTKTLKLNSRNSTIFNGDRTKLLNGAKLYTDSAIQLSIQIGNSGTLSMAYQQKSAIEELLGDTKGALESYKTFALIKDSVFNLEKDKKLTETAMRYEFEKKEAKAKSEQEKKDIRQRNIRTSISGGFLGALIFLVIVYKQRNKIASEKERSENLLLNILPAETAEELKNTGAAKARDFSEVTVLFTDFKNFTSITEQLSAQELVNEINYCYSAFDEIVTKYGIEKIKTIGDSYMCAGGLPVADKNHSVNTVKAALEIRDFMNIEREKKQSAGETFF
ncbi:MAG: tetratricopeptide repeat protein [Bacteroidetes bacterium]|nr:tetratricopeptide repeat protein [Bacteroidota bacterium]